MAILNQVTDRRESVKTLLEADFYLLISARREDKGDSFISTNIPREYLIKVLTDTLNELQS